MILQTGCVHTAGTPHRKAGSAHLKGCFKLASRLQGLTIQNDSRCSTEPPNFKSAQQDTVLTALACHQLASSSLSSTSTGSTSDACPRQKRCEENEQKKVVLICSLVHEAAGERERSALCNISPKCPLAMWRSRLNRTAQPYHQHESMQRRRYELASGS